MKARLSILAASLQVVILAGWTFQREWLLRTGCIIYLRTLPVDPRDFSGGITFSWSMKYPVCHHASGGTG